MPSLPPPPALSAAAVTGVPAGHGEAFNVLRYEDGQHYHSHYDTFDAEGYGAQASQRVRERGAGHGGLFILFQFRRAQLHSTSRLRLDALQPPL